MEKVTNHLTHMTSARDLSTQSMILRKEGRNLTSWVLHTFSEIQWMCGRENTLLRGQTRGETSNICYAPIFRKFCCCFFGVINLRVGQQMGKGHGAYRQPSWPSSSQFTANWSLSVEPPCTSNVHRGKGRGEKGKKKGKIGLCSDETFLQRTIFNQCSFFLLSKFIMTTRNTFDARKFLCFSL